MSDQIQVHFSGTYRYQLVLATKTSKYLTHHPFPVTLSSFLIKVLDLQCASKQASETTSWTAIYFYYLDSDLLRDYFVGTNSASMTRLL